MKECEILEYPFIEGSHEPTSVEEVVHILYQLLTLHKDNCVHGNICASNIVFGQFKSSLIDFDLSGKDNETKYPEGFVRDIHDGFRHEDAREGSVLRKEHDCFSFSWLMSRYDCEQPVTWADATKRVEQNDIQNVKRAQVCLEQLVYESCQRSHSEQLLQEVFPTN